MEPSEHTIVDRGEAMNSESNERNRYLDPERTSRVLDVFGPTVEFLISPLAPEAAYCIMRGTIPPGVSVPLHSHPDDESFYLLSGVVRALRQEADKFEWLELKAGGFFHIPSGAKHAWQNTSSKPAVSLIVTTPRLGRFFSEIGRPVTHGIPAPPTAGELERFRRLAAQYHHWLGTPDENAAVGISFF